MIKLNLLKSNMLCMLRHLNLLRTYYWKHEEFTPYFIYLRFVSQFKAVSESIKLTSDFLIEPYMCMC